MKVFVKENAKDLYTLVVLLLLFCLISAVVVITGEACNSIATRLLDLIFG